MIDNLIHLVFNGKTHCVSPPAWQHDYGQVLVFDDVELDNPFEVHLANTKIKGNASVHIGLNNQLEVPAAYMAAGLPIYGWVYTHPTIDSGETEYSFVIPIRERPEPVQDEPIPEPEQSTITELVALLQNAVNDAERYAQEAREAAQEVTGS